MAGTSHNGLISLVNFELAAYFTGITSGIGIPFRQWEDGETNDASPGLVDASDFIDSAGGARTSAEQGTIAADANTARNGSEDSDACGPHQDWFDHVHLLPKSPIDFGNIITLVEREFTLHSAFRQDSVVLASFTNNASPGVEFPTLTPPLTLYPGETFVDPTSTSNNGGIGLGTLAAPKVQATQDGLPTFDTNIVFEMLAPATDVELLVSGQRIVLVPQVYEAPCEEVLAWLTDIGEVLNGAEQRIALRKNPKQILNVTYRLDANDRQRMQALLLDWGDNVFGVPIWQDRTVLTANASAGATVYSITDGDEIDLRVGGLAVVFSNSYTYDVIEVASFTATSVTATSASVNAYSAGAFLIPLRTAVLRGSVRGQMYRNNLEDFQVTWEVTDNDTGAMTGSTTPGFWSIYNSRVLFDDPNVMENDTIQEDYSRRVWRIDNQTGVISQSSLWDRGKRRHEKGFVLRSRADLYTFKRLLTSLRGKQKSFYIPTFSDDFTVVATLTSGDDKMNIEAQEYVRLVRNRLPMSLIKVTFTDGTSVVRTITASTTISSTVEQLTMNTTWSTTKTADQVSRVECYELCRFDTDEIPINIERIGLARSTVPVVRVFDDN